MILRCGCAVWMKYDVGSDLLKQLWLQDIYYQWQRHLGFNVIKTTVFVKYWSGASSLSGVSLQGYGPYGCWNADVGELSSLSYAKTARREFLLVILVTQMSPLPQGFVFLGGGGWGWGWKCKEKSEMIWGIHFWCCYRNELALPVHFSLSIILPYMPKVRTKHWTNDSHDHGILFRWPDNVFAAMFCPCAKSGSYWPQKLFSWVMLMLYKWQSRGCHPCTKGGNYKIHQLWSYHQLCTISGNLTPSIKSSQDRVWNLEKAWLHPRWYRSSSLSKYWYKL